MKRIDDQPPLRVGRALHGKLEQITRGALRAIAAQHIAAFDLAHFAIRRAQRDDYALFTLRQSLQCVVKLQGDRGKTLKSLQQRSLEGGLMKGRNERVAVTPDRRLDFSQQALS